MNISDQTVEGIRHLLEQAGVSPEQMPSAMMVVAGRLAIVIAAKPVAQEKTNPNLAASHPVSHQRVSKAAFIEAFNQGLRNRTLKTLKQEFGAQLFDISRINGSNSPLKAKFLDDEPPDHFASGFWAVQSGQDSEKNPTWLVVPTYRFFHKAGLMDDRGLSITMHAYVADGLFNTHNTIFSNTITHWNLIEPAEIAVKPDGKIQVIKSGLIT